MEDDLVDVPEGTLPVTQNMLRKAIFEEPEKAWQMLKNNPVAVVALSKVRREILDDEEVYDTPNVNRFFDKYDQYLTKTTDFTTLLQKLGLALTTEFITEIWRREMQNPGITNINQFLLKALEVLNEQAETLENTANNRVIREMINYSMMRILDYEEYQKQKATQHLEAIEPSFEEYFDNLLSQEVSDVIPADWYAWMYFGSSSLIGLLFLRNRIAAILLDKLQNKFSDLPEDAKYQVAPFLHNFKNIIENTDRDH